MEYLLISLTPIVRTCRSLLLTVFVKLVSSDFESTIIKVMRILLFYNIVVLYIIVAVVCSSPSKTQLQTVVTNGTMRKQP